MYRNPIMENESKKISMNDALNKFVSDPSMKIRVYLYRKLVMDRRAEPGSNLVPDSWKMYSVSREDNGNVYELRRLGFNNIKEEFIEEFDEQKKANYRARSLLKQDEKAYDEFMDNYRAWKNDGSDNS